MNILLINHYAGSPKYGMEYRPYYLAKEWIKKGHNVKILASSHSHIRTHQADVGDSMYKDEYIEDVNYRWYKTPSHSGNGFGRVINILSFLKAIWKDSNKLIIEFKPDVVIASSTYPMDIWPARRIAIKSKAQLIYEVHDLWPLSPIELGNMPRYHPFIIWCQLAEDYAYKHANKVISMLPMTKPHMESRGMKPEKFHYIPNGVCINELENSQPLPSNIHFEIHKIKKRNLPIIGYAGTHGLANALDFLLDAAKLGEGKFEVILVGKGPDYSKLQQKIIDDNISNVKMLEAIPKQSIPSFLQEIDIAYIGLLPQPLFRFGISPNKLMDYMVAAKPVIMAIDTTNDIVSSVGCGVTVLAGNVDAVYNGIMKLITLPTNTLNDIGEKGREYILKNQTYSVLANDFINAIENEILDNSYGEIRSGNLLKND